MQGMDAGPACHMLRNVAVIELKGPFGEERTAHALYDTIRELLEEGARSFAINLAQVSVADSYTLGALAGAYNLVRQAGGRIRFFAAPERLIRAFRKFHLDSVLELYANEALALSNLQ
jgi:anti-anti-sigma factor